MPISEGIEEIKTVSTYEIKKPKSKLVEALAIIGKNVER